MNDNSKILFTSPYAKHITENTFCTLSHATKQNSRPYGYKEFVHDVTCKPVLGLLYCS